MITIYGIWSVTDASNIPYICAKRDSQVMATIALVSFCAGWKMGLDTILSL